MKNRPKLLKLAERDLDEILEYKSSFYPGTPGKFINDVESVLENIMEYPFMCPVYENNPRYRCAVIDEYLLFYRVLGDSQKVRVYRIIHGKRSIVQQLK